MANGNDDDDDKDKDKNKDGGNGSDGGGDKGKKDAPRALTTDDIANISASVQEGMRESNAALIIEHVTTAMAAAVGKDSELQKSLTEQIAAGMATLKKMPPKDDDGHGDDAGQLLAKMVELPNGSRMSVADLAKSHIQYEETTAQRAVEDAKRQQDSKLLTIKTELAKRSVLSESAALIAPGLAAKIEIDSDGNYLAKKVKVPNPLGTPQFITQESMSLDDFLDMIVKDNPNLVEAQTKNGGGGGGGGGDPAGKAFTAKQALNDAKVMEAWIAKDPEGCKKALDEFTERLGNGQESMTE